MNDTISSLSNQFKSFLDKSIHWLPDLIMAILVLIVFVFIAKFVKKLLKRVLERIRPNNSITQLITNIGYVFVITIGIILALEVLNLSGTVNKLLAGAGIVGLGVSFAFQDILANVFAGIIIAIRKPLDIGDMVELNGVVGQVEYIRLRNVYLHNFKGQIIIIPSRNILQNNIINFTQKGFRRVDINVGVSYNSDLEFVQRVAQQTIQSLPFVMHSRLIEFYYMGFGASSIDFSLRFWIDLNDYPDFLYAQSEAIKAIKKAFEDNNINIPFPIRTLDLSMNQLKISKEN